MDTDKPAISRQKSGFRKKHRMTRKVFWTLLRSLSYAGTSGINETKRIEKECDVILNS